MRKTVRYLRRYCCRNKQKHADVVELVDTLVLEASASAWEFESPHPHHSGDTRLDKMQTSGCSVQSPQSRQLPARLLHPLSRIISFPMSLAAPPVLSSISLNACITIRRQCLFA